MRPIAEGVHRSFSGIKLESKGFKSIQRSSAALLILAFLSICLGTACRTPSNLMREPGLMFEVYWSRDIAHGIGRGDPVLLNKAQIGRVVQVVTRYDTAREETLFFAKLEVWPPQSLRLGDEFVVIPDGPNGRPYVEVTPKEGDRMTQRLIEPGMLIEGESSSSLSRRARKAWEGVKDAAGKAKENVKNAWEVKEE